MSVVGLTSGSGAKAIRPSAASAASVATSASTRDGGMRPLVPREAGGQREAEDERGTRRPSSPRHLGLRPKAPQRRCLWPRLQALRRRRLRPHPNAPQRRRLPPRPKAPQRRRLRPHPRRARGVFSGGGRAQQCRACFGQQRAAAEDAGGLGREVLACRPAPRRSARRPPGAPSPSSTVRSRPQCGELGVVGRDEHRAALAGELAQMRRERVLVAAVHAAGRLVEADHRWRLALQDDREREPLALAAGEVARVAVGEARRGRRPGAPRRAAPPPPARRPGSRRGSGAAARRSRRARSGRGSAARGPRLAAAGSTCPRRCGPSARPAPPA